MKNEIMLESAKFTAAEAPIDLSNENKLIVKKHFNNSFIIAFNKVVYIASLLCFLGSLMALMFISKRDENIIKS